MKSYTHMARMEYNKRIYDSHANIHSVNYKQFLPKNKKTKILDIGCGKGYFLYYLKKEGYTNFFGIDIDKEMITFCRKNITDNVRQEDALAFLEKVEGEYDAIVANEVLEHIPRGEIIRLLNMIYKSLKPGGVFIAKVPNMANLFNLFARYKDFTHTTGFTPESLYRALALTHFEDIEIYGARGPNTVKGMVGNITKQLLFFLIKSLYRFQRMPAPQILDYKIFSVARKS